MSGWGTTGRVTLEGFAQVAWRVLVDGAKVGYAAAYVEGKTGFFAVQSVPWDNLGDFPSREHAVMAVLRRTAPKVWAAERPVVYHTMRTTYEAVPNAARVAHEFARATYVARARSTAPTSHPVPEFWSKRQAAEYAGLSERTIHNYVLRGELTAYRVGARAVRFLRRDVEALFTPTARAARSAVTA